LLEVGIEIDDFGESRQRLLLTTGVITSLTERAMWVVTERIEHDGTARYKEGDANDESARMPGNLAESILYNRS